MAATPYTDSIWLCGTSTDFYAGAGNKHITYSIRVHGVSFLVTVRRQKFRNSPRRVLWGLDDAGVGE